MAGTIGEIALASALNATDLIEVEQDPAGTPTSKSASLTQLMALLAKSTLAAGALAASAPHKLTQTFNNAGVAFTALEVDATDTASAAGSLLLDLKVGGTSKFAVRKDGRLTIGGGGYLLWSNADDLSISSTAGYQRVSAYSFRDNSLYSGIGDPGTGSGIDVRLHLAAGKALGWTSGSIISSGTYDVTLWRDAADVLAQRRGANPQAQRIYNTYTDASNYERGFARWSSNVFEIGTGNAGTGSARDLALLPAGALRFGTHSAIGAETVTGYITIKDAGGTTRKLAVVS